VQIDACMFGRWASACLADACGVFPTCSWGLLQTGVCMTCPSHGCVQVLNVRTLLLEFWTQLDTDTPSAASLDAIGLSLKAAMADTEATFVRLLRASPTSVNALRRFAQYQQEVRGREGGAPLGAPSPHAFGLPRCGKCSRLHVAVELAPCPSGSGCEQEHPCCAMCFRLRTTC
jgi:hypothetical protein